MIFGIPIATFTIVHVILSLIGILAGLVALIAAIGHRWRAGWTWLFLVTTVLTSVTGLMFPGGLDPARVVGVISLIALVIAIVALFGPLAGTRRVIYVVAATLALYLNSFVAVTQAFQKLPFLHALAPTQSEQPFLVAQVVLLVVMVILAALVLLRFRPVRAVA